MPVSMRAGRGKRSKHDVTPLDWSVPGDLRSNGKGLDAWDCEARHWSSRGSKSHSNCSPFCILGTILIQHLDDMSF